MNIFISADDKYILPAQVMLTSFFKNNNSEPHTIYFMHRNTQQPNIKKLDDIVKAFNSEFIPIQITADNFKDFTATERFPIEIYFRLSIPSILPKTEERALWLDVDLIVNKSLFKFYNQPFDGKAFIACRDIYAKEEHIQNLGLYSSENYINSGVVLFNLPVMRKTTLNDYYNFFVKNEKVILWPDQDILNGFYENRIKVLESDNYNVQILDWRHNVYDLNSASIIHFVGPFKPWSKIYTNPAAQMWDKYYALTFNKGNSYIHSQKIHRKLEKKILAPLRRFILETYNKSDVLKKIRRKFKLKS